MALDYDRLDDAELIQRSLAGDKLAYYFLAIKHKKVVFSYIYGILKNHHDAEDITELTFLKGFEHLQTLEKPACVKSWFLTIGGNCARNQLRKNKQESLYDSWESLCDSADLVDEASEACLSAEDEAIRTISRKEMKEMIKHALPHLNEKDKLIAEKYYFEEQSCKEIGKALGMTKTNVSTQLDRIRKRLKEILSKRYTEEEINGLLKTGLPPLLFSLVGELSANMKRIVKNSLRFPPTTTSTSLTPGFSTTVVVIGISLGLGWGRSQFQVPYSYNAPESEKMVKIVNTPVDKKPPLLALPVNQEKDSTEKDSAQKTDAADKHDVWIKFGDGDPIKGSLKVFTTR